MGGLLKGKVNTTSYSYEDWQLKENTLAQHQLPQSASLFSVGNGFIGVRGVFEEDESNTGQARNCVFLNGVYDKVKINYHENAVGFAQYSDTRLPVADPSKIRFFLDDEMCFLDGTIEHYERWLDYRSGCLSRRLQWTSRKGKKITVVFERFASLTNKHLFVQKVRITPHNFSGEIRILSTLDARFGNENSPDEAGNDPRIGPKLGHNPYRADAQIDEPQVAGFVQALDNSGFRVASACRHSLSAQAIHVRQLESHYLQEEFTLDVISGETVTLEKTSCFIASQSRDSEMLIRDVSNCLGDEEENYFDTLFNQQKTTLEDFWPRANIEIGKMPALTSTLRFNLLQLLFAVGRDGESSISAKGQTGEGYEGHYFWDAEILCLPFFAFTQPTIARQMLHYRYRHLEHARVVAGNMGHKRGALFPWRTISGYECSAYFPAGSAQYHINADIAYAVKLYDYASDDTKFIKDYGATLVWETARIWLEIGYHNPRLQSRFVINNVTGPDEYTAIVNNNFYTNVMAKAHLEYAVALYERYPNIQAVEHIALSQTEVQQWAKAAEAMYLPYDDTLGIHKQDDSFLEKEVWDFANTPADHYPLLLHYHPLTIYRYQVSKQADTVLADFLEGHRFDTKTKRRDYDYYKNICIHDSTLSPCVYSIMASELNKLEDAEDMFSKTVFIDVENLHKNSDHGLHMAAMGGAWMALTFGFGGMRISDGKLRFNPRLPDTWPHYQFSLQYRGRRLRVDVDRNTVKYTLMDGASVEIMHINQSVELHAHTAAAFRYTH